MIRNGNHFVKFGKEWCLIDGPWFHYLESIRQGGTIPVRLYKSVTPIMWPNHPISSMPGYEYVEWEPRFWHPGYHHIYVGWWRRPSIYTTAQQERNWNRWQKGRLKIGYMALPDGKLPPFINLFELPEHYVEDIIIEEEARWK